MSGIAGVFQRNLSPIPETLIHLQSEALSHRGSIGLEFKPQGYVGLSLRRQQKQADLAPLDVECSLMSQNGLFIVADARIDNREELYSAFQTRKKPLNQTDDCELILSAYEQWGRNCTERILGDFAFAIFDIAKKQLFCGRDHFGVKPFFYFLNEHKFVFGSEIKAILVDPEIPVLFNEEKIADFLLELFEDKSRTFYQQIFRLPPAHNLIITPDQFRIERYWQPDPSREIRLDSDDEYTEIYRDIFVDSVRSRIAGEDTVGAMLSGGLDSSSVTCVAEALLRQASSRPLHTYSSIFDTVPKSDEREFINIVLEQGYFQPHFIQGDQLNPIRDIVDVIDTQDEPSYAPQLFLNRGVWAAAQQNGTQVLLEGLMGDNIVSHGYAYLEQLAKAWKWIPLYRQVEMLAKNHENPQPVNRIMNYYLWEFGIKSWVPERVKRTWRALRGRPGSPDPLTVPAHINPEFACRIHLKERLQKQVESLARAKTVQQKHSLDLENGLIPTALEIYNIEISRFGMEARFPFLDRRLAEFCLAIPPEQKINQGYTRWIARKAMYPYLPAQIRTRTSKGNLGWNFMRGIKSDAPLIQQISQAADPMLGEFLDRKVLNDSLDRIITGTAVENDAMLVFLSTVLAAWLNRKPLDNMNLGGDKGLNYSKNDV